ncbi:hypothetical protein JCM10213v2_000437 [Rhodosporidiobolus nylandii]
MKGKEEGAGAVVAFVPSSRSLSPLDCAEIAARWASSPPPQSQVLPRGQREADPFAHADLLPYTQVTSSFLIGVLFTSLLWDSTVLYGLKEPISKFQIEAVETYYLSWWNGAMAVKIFLHVVMLVLFLSLVAKWARRSETAYYFTGASILFLLLTASLYIVITLPSLRIIARDPLNKAAFIIPGDDFFTRIQAWAAARNSGTLGDRARENAAALANLKPMTWEERVQHVQVMCAANTLYDLRSILLPLAKLTSIICSSMGLLAGVVLLQVSEWWLDDSIAEEEAEEARKQLAGTTPTPAPAAAQAPGKTKVTAEKKKQ